ncbi:universal stress protein [Helcobacillus massiliensis]|uniref:universal stress protein n=1 Tax=Helcobacillus massiliensis TaxID=521392 RepID=UPI0021A47079|nr:universal stress protein [Helcobacillus massiliensis]MCT1556536.1 universal stress protein [Helcobacillus massiliensis]MCT2035730.1 universal stress protein [Helcobacillus massiliensis]MCT2331188.1 universal stress protein [Helcobacillus massiliensis]
MSIVVGYIPTAEGDAALGAALAWAESSGSSVMIANLQRSSSPDPRHATADQLESARARGTEAGLSVAVRTVQVPEDVSTSTALIRLVEEEGADALTIGVRRNREFAPHLLGSTVQHILLDAPCDVLVA